MVYVDPYWDRFVWKTIDTAPKPDLNDTSVCRYLLGFIPTDDIEQYVSDPASLISVIWWEPKLQGGIWTTDADLACQPTHWMALPDAPTQTGEK